MDDGDKGVYRDVSGSGKTRFGAMSWGVQRHNRRFQRHSGIRLQTEGGTILSI